MCWSSAHFQRLARRFRRDGGGNTAGFDTMWAIGRVQSAVAEGRFGLGVYVEAAGWGQGSVNVSFGSHEPWFGFVRLPSLGGNMLVRRGHGNMPKAPRVCAGVERF